jgi:putative nucleotidyltransferase with HDIG domain
VHLTLGSLRTFQAVFYASAFFQLDGFAVTHPSAGNANRSAAGAMQQYGKQSDNMMKTNYNIGFFIAIILVLVVEVIEISRIIPVSSDRVIDDFNNFSVFSGAVSIIFLIGSLIRLQKENALQKHLFFQLQHRAVEIEKVYKELNKAYEQTIEGWSRALDLRDKETEGHSQRVTEVTLQLARAAGINETELLDVRRGALLHDIGKMGVPDCILLKPDKLTEEEWGVVRQHPNFGYKLLSPIDYLRNALDIPYCHHEKWDGTGYPRGLKGEQIPLAARLFAVADVWDALRYDRPYRKGWSDEKVREHIKSLAGTHFDPKAVELFLSIESKH